VLFVVAHQDDECFMSTRIARDVARGHRVLLAVLTDGSAGCRNPKSRDAESRRVLARLGVEPRDILFVGTDARIPDGKLHLHLDRAVDALNEAIGQTTVDRIFTCAYEGGHQDHDAAHVIALALAAERGMLHRTWQMPLYNGFRTRWKFFRIGTGPPPAGRNYTRSLAGEPVRSHAFLCRHYPSQWRSWIGLFPGLFFRLFVARRETVAAVLPIVPPRRPHPGDLLYERRAGLTFDEFCASTGRFSRERIGDAAQSCVNSRR